MTEEVEDPRFQRRSGPSRPDPSFRSPTQRDRDRVLYSDAFRRLAGVTQVALGKPSLGLHNRLTHSLKVDQVGASILTRLRALEMIEPAFVDTSAVSTACLAHDIGHPPFGHAGEVALHSLVVCEPHRGNPRTPEQRKIDPCRVCLLEDGFEGNAQTFRVLAVLSAHDVSEKEPFGLDLTRASLRASNKYPWTRGTIGRKANKWGAYDCDANILAWTTGALGSAPNLDAQVMDWADDVSYAVHDIEDFFRAGLIPLDDYKPNTGTLETLLEYVESPQVLGPLSQEVRTALEGMLELFPFSRFADRSMDRAGLDRLRRRLLTRFIDAASVVDGQLVRDEIENHLNGILKQFIWFHIIDDPQLANIQHGQQRILGDVFRTLHGLSDHAYRSGLEASEQELRRLPYGLRRTIDCALLQPDTGYTLSQSIVRGVLDYIAGLSDVETYQLHSVLEGREAAGYL